MMVSAMLFIFIVMYQQFSSPVTCKVLDKGTLYVAEGDEIDMRCQNKTDGTFANLVWLSNAYASEGKKAVYSLTAAGEDYIKPSYKDRVVRFNGTSIRIKNVRSEDSGNYECNIVFKIKKLKVEMLAVYDVVVITPPSVIKSDKTLVSGLRGESLEVYCEVQALSPFNVTWIKTIGNINFNNTQFTEMQHETLDRSSSKNIYIKRSKMTISNLTDENTGRYRCVAYNLGGHRYTIVHVRMKSKPKVVSENHVKINVSDDGDLFCQAKGFPVIYFKWKFYNRNNLVTLSPSDDYNSRFQVSHSVYDSHSEVGSSKLQLTNVQKEDYQTYTCIAENSVGRAEHSIKLDGCAPPDPPTISGSDLRATTDSVTLRWEYGDSGKNPVTSVTIKYRNSTDETWTKIQIHQHIREYVVTNLQENTMYEFKIQASNAVGPSKYSKVVRKPTDSSLLDTTSDDSNGRPILDDLDTPTLIAILGGTFIALLIAFICVCVFMKRINKSDQNEVVNQNSSSIAGATSLHTQHYSIDGGVPPTIHMEMESLINNPADDWEFPRDRLQTATVLGSGAFGIVMKGVAQGIKGSLGQVTVAVKMVRDHTNDIATKDLIGELNLLKLIPEHPNVVGLLGCCTRSQPFYVIVEYCANGDLQGFLRSSRGIYERYYWSSYGGAVPNLTAKMLLTFAWQITKGMSHLAGMKVIHRDLAARNILVDDQLVCKISDFGFARDTYLEDHYLKRSTGGRFPIKWMAIESLLDSISTTKSDVWSYGVVLWELVTLGASPYPGMNSYEVVSFLQDGYRMDKPKHCSNELYLLMMDCWNVSPGRRPSFNELAERCQQLVESSDVTEYISMNYYQEHMYINFDVNGSFLSVAGVSNSATPRSTLNRRLDAHLTANGRERSTSGDMIPPRQSRSLSISSNGRFATNPTPNVCLTPRTPKKSVPLPPNRSSSITSRSNSITALSERSATATSSASNSNENSTLLGTVDS